MISTVDVTEPAEAQAAVCSVFANPKRIMILWLVAEQERSVGEIASLLGMSMQCTSQHLRVMREQGILETRRAGQTIYYSLAGNEITASCRLLLQPHFRVAPCGQDVAAEPAARPALRPPEPDRDAAG